MIKSSNKAMDTALRVKKRRKVILKPAEIELFKNLFDNTAAERAKAFLV